MELIVNVSCDVEFRKGDRFRWESNSPKSFSVAESPHSLDIRQIGGGGGVTVVSQSVGGSRQVVMSGSNNIVIGGNTGGSVVIGGASGGVWVNGKRVDVPSGSEEVAPEIPHLIVYVPDNTSGSLRFSSSLSAFGDARFGHIALSTSGSCDVDLICNSASVKTSGSSDVRLAMTGGELSCNCSGSTSIRVYQAK